MEAGENNAIPLIPPRYLCSSTGSLELAGVRERGNASTVLAFESEHRKTKEDLTLTETAKLFAAKKWRKCSAKRVLSKNFPTLSGLGRYPLRDLPSDAVAGLTAGITMIPQGMAFASLSTLPPIVGLYICLFASLTYFLLGTAHQLSWGCVAVLSILMGDVLDNYEAKVRAAFGVAAAGVASLDSTAAPFLNISDSVTMAGVVVNSTSASVVGSQLADALSVQKKIEVVGAVTMLSGILLAVLGKLGLGRVTSFMSNSLITSFTVGVSFHVITSQIKTALGLDVPRQNGIFKFIRLWVLMLSRIDQANPATILVTLVCIVVLYTCKRFVNEKYKARLRVPVPIELLVVIAATVITAFTGLSEKYSVSVVKDIPVGVPRPRIPDLSLGTDYMTEGLVIIIISYTQNVAMAKLMGLKHSYRIDANQEMFACGAVSVVCSVFSGYISGASVSRSLVQDGAGGKTQVASLFAAALVFVVIMLIGPYFYFLPKCVLAAIIIVNLRSMFLKMATVPALWRKSRADALVWIITCVATVVLETKMGLLVGIASCILFVLMRSQRDAVDVVSQIGDSGVWLDRSRYWGGEAVVNGVMVVKINSSLYFANAEIVTDAVFKRTGVNPIKWKPGKPVEIMVDSPPVKHPTTISPEKNSEAKSDTALKNENGVSTVAVDLKEGNLTGSSSSVAKATPVAAKTSQKMPFSSLVVDLGCVPFVDVMGVQALEFLIAKYLLVGVAVCFCNAQRKCVDTLRKTGFLAKHEKSVYLTTEAAIQHASSVTVL